MADRRPTRGIKSRVREAIGRSRDPLFDTELLLLLLLTRGKPPDLKASQNCWGRTFSRVKTCLRLMAPFERFGLFVLSQRKRLLGFPGSNVNKSALKAFAFV